jgi:hypothetical protein
MVPDAYGTVTGVRLDGEAGVVTLELVSRVGEDMTVGPGEVEVTLPLSAAGHQGG